MTQAYPTMIDQTEFKDGDIAVKVQYFESTRIKGIEYVAHASFKSKTGFGVEKFTSKTIFANKEAAEKDMRAQLEVVKTNLQPKK